MKRALKFAALTVVGLVTLTGCVFLPATAAHAPVTSPNEHAPTHTMPETVEAAQTPDQRFLTAVRNAAPATRGVTDAALIEAAHSSCDLAREFGYEGGIDALVVLAISEGWGAEEGEVLGAIYGAGLAVYCPEMLS